MELNDEELEKIAGGRNVNCACPYCGTPIVGHWSVIHGMVDEHMNKCPQNPDNITRNPVEDDPLDTGSTFLQDLVSWKKWF